MYAFSSHYDTLPHFHETNCPQMIIKERYNSRGLFFCLCNSIIGRTTVRYFRCTSEFYFHIRSYPSPIDCF